MGCFRENTFAIAAGVPLLAAFIWAVWTSNKSLIDPIAGNMEGKDIRNSWNTIGSLEHGRKRGYSDEKNNWLFILCRFNKLPKLSWLW